MATELLAPLSALPSPNLASNMGRLSTFQLRKLRLRPLGGRRACRTAARCPLAVFPPGPRSGRGFRLCALEGAEQGLGPTPQVGERGSEQPVPAGTGTVTTLHTCHLIGAPDYSGDGGALRLVGGLLVCPGTRIP